MHSDDENAESSANSYQLWQVINEQQAAATADAFENAAYFGGIVFGSYQAGFTGAGADAQLNQSTFYIPQTQAQTHYYNDYYHLQQSSDQWAEDPQFATPVGSDVRSPATFNANIALVFHNGYGYRPHVPYGPMSSVTNPFPPVHADGQLYSSHHVPSPRPPFYQQMVLSTSFVNTSALVPVPDVASLVGPSHQNGRGRMPPGPNYGFPQLLGTFSQGSFPGNAYSPGFHAVSSLYEGFSQGTSWFIWSNRDESQRSQSHYSAALTHQSRGPLGPHRSYAQNGGMASQPQRLSYGFISNSSQRRNMHNGRNNEGSSSRTGSFTGAGANIRTRGPRASKSKSQITADQSSSTENRDPKVVHNDSYNQPDFVTDYDAAKFFIIKSSNEDNVHKSIKYGVWASGALGNRKLDAGYREAKESRGTCPVFLLFSVTSSSQFCGLAEMTGPVDFEKSVDYWHQDKWSGQFPVKWHIIKDVPNRQFNHILRDDDNGKRPVTFSRDTQEIKLEQGIEMLKILKSHEAETSILDDFEFYDERERVRNERKASQQANTNLVGTSGENDECNSDNLPSGLINGFAQVVRVDENNPSAEKASSAASADSPQNSAGSPGQSS